MRTGARAAIGIVAKGVNVHAPLGIGIVSGNVPGDGRGSTLLALLKRHLTLDGGVSAENGNCSVSLAIHEPETSRSCVHGRCRHRREGEDPSVGINGCQWVSMAE